MKSRICIVLICTILIGILMTDTVYCLDYDEYNSDHCYTALELGYKYFNKYDIKKTVTDLIKVKDEKDITIDSEQFSYMYKVATQSPPVEYFVKNVYLNIRDVDIKVRRQYELENKPWEYTEITTIGRSAFDLLPDEFRDFLASVDTMQSVFDSYSSSDGFVYSDSALEKNGFLQFYPQERYDLDEASYAYSSLKPYDLYYFYQDRFAASGNRLWHVEDVMVPNVTFPDHTNGDHTRPSYVAYMTDPNSIKIAYGERLLEFDWELEYYKGLSKIIATLSYSEEVDETGEKRLEKIEFYTEREWNSEYYTSPPTGDKTVMLVAIMIASSLAIFKLRSRLKKNHI